MEKDKRIDGILSTGVFLALLLFLQWATLWTRKYAGAYIADSILNGILVLGALHLGNLWCSAAAAVLWPFCAYVFGMGPEVFQAVPAVALGNLVYVMAILFTAGQKKQNLLPNLGWAALASLLKAAVLYGMIVQVVIPVMGPVLPAEQAESMRSAYSWTPLITAFLGAAAAILLRSIKKKK